MSNNMLGLKIVRIYNGLTDLFEINGNQSWTKKIWDIRKDLNFDNLDGTSTVLMLKCIEGGHILTIASFIDGRGDDCKSAWIYVPASIDIKGMELVEVIEMTKKEILATEFDDEKLEQLFSRTYPEAPAVKKTQENTGDKCACRYYGKDVKYELHELLANMYQSYYSNYKSVFLLDNTTDLKFIGDDLTKEKVYSIILVKAPNEKDGFKPFLHIHFSPYYISLRVRSHRINRNSFVFFSCLFRRKNTQVSVNGIAKFRNGNGTLIPMQVRDEIVHNRKIAAVVTAVFRVADNFILNADFLNRTAKRTVDISANDKFIFFQLAFNFANRTDKVNISIRLRRTAYQRKRAGRTVFERNHNVLSIDEIPKVVVRTTAVNIPF